MKKLLSILSLIGFITFTSCNDDDTANQVDRDTIAEVFEINQNTTFTAANNYRINYSLNPVIYNSDMIMIYRLAGTSGALDIWEQLPQTYNFTDGELSYTFDFTVQDINLYLLFNGNVLTPAFTDNQVFRVVIIPGYLSNKGGAAPVDFSDYNAVVKYYNINQQNIKSLTPGKK